MKDEQIIGATCKAICEWAAANADLQDSEAITLQISRGEGDKWGSHAVFHRRQPDGSLYPPMPNLSSTLVWQSGGWKLKE